MLQKVNSMNYHSVFSRYFLPVAVFFIFLFLYIPIILLVVFAFNREPLNYYWAGFTTQWFYELFASTEVWYAFKNSLIVASSAATLSLVMGSLLVFYLTRSGFEQLLMLFYANLAIPEIVLAVGLMSFFYAIAVPLGLTTLIAGHSLLGLGYVVPLIYARFLTIDKALIEASLDLGATHMQTFFKVVLPLLSPALFAGALLVFVISFDDFIVSFFCTGASVQTLPIYIFYMIRMGASPMVSALSTVLLLVSSTLVLLFSSLQIKRTGIFG